MRSLWLYLGGLLIALVAINVLLMRTIRAEKRRQAKERPAIDQAADGAQTSATSRACAAARSRSMRWLSCSHSARSGSPGCCLGRCGFRFWHSG
jgi:hypothetical protein